MNILIVGIDSTLGAALAKNLPSNSNVTGTSRRKDKNADTLYFDLSNDLSAAPDWPENIDAAFIAAGMTNQKLCEDNPALADFINVDQTLALINQLTSKNIDVIFPSTNLVLGCEEPFQKSGTPYRPLGKYAGNKVKVEKAVLGNPKVAVARLSKVLDANTGIIKNWLEKSAAGQPVTAFTDLYISPVSLDYTSAFLTGLIAGRHKGLWQISGDGEISYYDLALKLAGISKLQIAKIKPETVQGKNIPSPMHPSLDMQKTARALSIVPQSLPALLSDLFPA